ncbi:MAG TPA: ribonuclease H, partial [Gemmatimonadales bacterium]|nr:ribonuclease H [Gemmatimonadales bacterium]
MPTPIAVAHLDESCLGNGRAGDNPGGSGALIEIRHQGVILRRDVYIHAPATTNNRMALSGAIAVLQLLAQKEKRLQLVLISDSEYLVKGVREWAPGWMARGWKRKGGAIENLELWQTLMRSVPLHDAQWTWVRGHAGHPKNEYVNDLAVGAATRQETSAGIVESGFDAWLLKERAKKRYLDYDPDAAFAALESRLAKG